MADSSCFGLEWCMSGVNMDHEPQDHIFDAYVAWKLMQMQTCLDSGVATKAADSRDWV